MSYQDEILPREKVFRDPVHNYIYVQYQVILDLINTSEFQRLRRIKQLGTTSLTFHGAEHTRFGHCLGVYEITRRICDNFQRNYPAKCPVMVCGMIRNDSLRCVLRSFMISATVRILIHLNTFSTRIMRPLRWRLSPHL